MNPNAKKTRQYKNNNDIDAIIEIGDDIPQMLEDGFTDETINLAIEMKKEGFCIPHGPRKAAMECGDAGLRRFLELVRNGMDPYDAELQLDYDMKAAAEKGLASKRRIWIRLGGIVLADKEAAAAILKGDREALVGAIRENGFTLDGETYIHEEVDFSFSPNELVLKAES